MKAKNEISKERKETVETAIEIKQNNLEISQNLLECIFELYPENRRRSGGCSAGFCRGRPETD